MTKKYQRKPDARIYAAPLRKGSCVKWKHWQNREREKEMKKMNLVLGFAAAASLLVTACGSSKTETTAAATEAATTAAATEAAGEIPADAVTATGTAKGNNGDVTVEVTMTKDKLYKIEVTEQQETEGIGDKAIAEIPGKMIENNSVKVDAVSGATNTSNAIIEAVKTAIKSAGFDPADFENEIAAAAKAEDQFFRDAFDQTDADRQRMVDAANVLFGEMPDEVAQAALIDGAQLFQQDDGGQFQAVLGVDVVVGGKFGFHAGFARNGSDNDRGAVFVPDIVLNDHDRTVALLLGADATAQIGVIHIAAQICVVHSVMTSFVYLGVSAYVEVKRQNRIKVGERLNTLRFI